MSLTFVQFITNVHVQCTCTVYMYVRLCLSGLPFFPSYFYVIKLVYYRDVFPCIHMYISFTPPSMQNWEHCGGYFWIKHCLELILTVAALDQPILPAPPTPQLPSIASVGPAQTSLTHDVPEPPAISSQLPEVRVWCVFTPAHV